eukprot:jgi/Botrbrau1/12675/Bobra.67_1s0039.1
MDHLDSSHHQLSPFGLTDSVQGVVFTAQVGSAPTPISGSKASTGSPHTPVRNQVTTLAIQQELGLTPGPIRKSPQDITQASKVSSVKRLQLATSSAPCILFHGSSVLPHTVTEDRRGVEGVVPAHADVRQASSGGTSPSESDRLADGSRHQRCSAANSKVFPRMVESLQEYDQRSMLLRRNPTHETSGHAAEAADIEQIHGGRKEVQQTQRHEGMGLPPPRGQNNLEGAQIEGGCEHRSSQAAKAVLEHEIAPGTFALHCGGQLNLVLTPTQSPTLKAHEMGTLLGNPIPIAILPTIPVTSPESTAVYRSDDSQCGEGNRIAQPLLVSATCGCEPKVPSLDVEPTLLGASISGNVTLPPTQIDDDEPACESPLKAPDCTQLVEDTIMSGAKPHDQRSSGLSLPASCGGAQDRLLGGQMQSQDRADSADTHNLHGSRDAGNMHRESGRENDPCGSALEPGVKERIAEVSKIKQPGECQHAAVMPSALPLQIQEGAKGTSVESGLEPSSTDMQLPGERIKDPLGQEQSSKVALPSDHACAQHSSRKTVELGFAGESADMGEGAGRTCFVTQGRANSGDASAGGMKPCSGCKQQSPQLEFGPQAQSALVPLQDPPSKDKPELSLGECRARGNGHAQGSDHVGKLLHHGDRATNVWEQVRDAGVAAHGAGSGVHMGHPAMEHGPRASEPLDMCQTVGTGVKSSNRELSRLPEKTMGKTPSQATSMVISCAVSRAGVRTQNLEGDNGLITSNPLKVVPSDLNLAPPEDGRESVQNPHVSQEPAASRESDVVRLANAPEDCVDPMISEGEKQLALGAALQTRDCGMSGALQEKRALMDTGRSSSVKSPSAHVRAASGAMENGVGQSPEGQAVPPAASRASPMHVGNLDTSAGKAISSSAPATSSAGAAIPQNTPVRVRISSEAGKLEPRYGTRQTFIGTHAIPTLVDVSHTKETLGEDIVDPPTAFGSMLACRMIHEQIVVGNEGQALPGAAQTGINESALMLTSTERGSHSATAEGAVCNAKDIALLATTGRDPYPSPASATSCSVEDPHGCMADGAHDHSAPPAAALCAEVSIAVEKVERGTSHTAMAGRGTARAVAPPPASWGTDVEPGGIPEKAEAHAVEALSARNATSPGQTVGHGEPGTAFSISLGSIAGKDEVDQLVEDLANTQAGLESGSLTQEYMDPNSIRCFVETSVAGADLEEVCRALGQKYKQSVLALDSMRWHRIIHAARKDVGWTSDVDFAAGDCRPEPLFDTDNDVDIQEYLCTASEVQARGRHFDLNGFVKPANRMSATSRRRSVRELSHAIDHSTNLAASLGVCGADAGPIPGAPQSNVKCALPQWPGEAEEPDGVQKDEVPQGHAADVNERAAAEASMAGKKVPMANPLACAPDQVQAKQQESSRVCVPPVHCETSSTSGNCPNVLQRSALQADQLENSRVHVPAIHNEARSSSGNCPKEPHVNVSVDHAVDPRSPSEQEPRLQGSSLRRHQSGREGQLSADGPAKLALLPRSPPDDPAASCGKRGTDNDAGMHLVLPDSVHTLCGHNQEQEGIRAEKLCSRTQTQAEEVLEASPETELQVPAWMLNGATRARHSAAICTKAPIVKPLGIEVPPASGHFKHAPFVCAPRGKSPTSNPRGSSQKSGQHPGQSQSDNLCSFVPATAQPLASTPTSNIPARSLPSGNEHRLEGTAIGGATACPVEDNMNIRADHGQQATQQHHLRGEMHGFGDSYTIPQTTADELQKVFCIDTQEPPSSGRTVDERHAEGVLATKPPLGRLPLSPSQVLNRRISMSGNSGEGDALLDHGGQLHTPVKPVQNLTRGSSGKKGVHRTPRRPVPSPRLYKMAVENGEVAPGPWVGTPDNPIHSPLPLHGITNHPSPRLCRAVGKDVPSRIRSPDPANQHPIRGGPKGARPVLRLVLDTQDTSQWSPRVGFEAAEPQGQLERGAVAALQGAGEQNKQPGGDRPAEEVQRRLEGTNPVPGPACKPVDRGARTLRGQARTGHGVSVRGGGTLKVRQKQLQEAARRKKGLIRSALLSRSQKGDLLSRQLVWLPKQASGHAVKRRTLVVTPAALTKVPGARSPSATPRGRDRAADGHPSTRLNSAAGAHAGAVPRVSTGRPAHEETAQASPSHKKVRHNHIATSPAGEASRRLRTSSERAAAVAELPILHLSGCGTWREKTPIAEAAANFTPEELPHAAPESSEHHSQFTHTPHPAMQYPAGRCHSPTAAACEGAPRMSKSPVRNPNSETQLPPPLRLQRGDSMRDAEQDPGKEVVGPTRPDAVGGAREGAVGQVPLGTRALRAQNQDARQIAPEVLGQLRTRPARAAASLINSAVRTGNRHGRGRGRGKQREMSPGLNVHGTRSGRARDVAAVRKAQGFHARKVNGAAGGLALLSRGRPRDPYSFPNTQDEAPNRGSPLSAARENSEANAHAQNDGNCNTVLPHRGQSPRPQCSQSPSLILGPKRQRIMGPSHRTGGLYVERHAIFSQSDEEREASPCRNFMDVVRDIAEHQLAQNYQRHAPWSGAGEKQPPINPTSRACLRAAVAASRLSVATLPPRAEIVGQNRQVIQHKDAYLHQTVTGAGTAACRDEEVQPTRRSNRRRSRPERLQDYTQATNFQDVLCNVDGGSLTMITTRHEECHPHTAAAAAHRWQTKERPSRKCCSKEDAANIRDL